LANADRRNKIIGSRAGIRGGPSIGGGPKQKGAPDVGAYRPSDRIRTSIKTRVCN